MRIFWYLCLKLTIDKEIMMSIENSVKEICKSKGLKMADLAQKVGMSQSNLMTAIRRNPKLSTLQDIADALGVGVSAIVERKTSVETVGMIVVNGETLSVVRPSARAVRIPVFRDYGELRGLVRNFISQSIGEEKNGVLWGLIDNQMLHLLYDAFYANFHLSLHYGNGEVFMAQYDVEMYGSEGVWNLSEVMEDVINDIEGAVNAKTEGQEVVDNIEQ